MKKFILFALCLNIAFAAHSQKNINSKTDDFTPGLYIGANGGLNWFFGENNFPLNTTAAFTMDQNIGYLGRLELGYHFTPVYSLRGFLGYRLNNYFNTTVNPVSSENLAFDFLLNLTNLKNYDPTKKLTFSLFAGLGANYINNSPAFSVAGSLRGGLQTDYNISKALALNLIVEGSILTDNYNKVPAGTPIDLEAAVSLGLAYRFPGKQTTTPVVEESLPTATKPVEKPVIIPEEKPVVAQDTVKPEAKPVVEPVQIAKEEPVKPVVSETSISDKINEHVFFTINQREITASGQKESMQRIADFIASHPESKVIISGYADRGTGTVEVNNMVSKERAVIVANTLIQEYGVPYKNIWVRWFGSGVQPYQKATQNRLVIVRGAATFKEANAIPQLETNKRNAVNTESNTESGTVNSNVTVATKAEPALFKVLHFVEGSAAVTDPKAKDEIKLVAEYLKRNPSAMVSISGYADKVSDDEKKSTEISKQRAEAVANTLINAHLISSERIQVRWYGAQKESGTTPSMNKMVLISTVK
ncbi:MAG: OmpA family protein [Paludibacter sp.]|nr:OmpA family protein [Paludibacter sp.]